MRLRSLALLSLALLSLVVALLPGCYLSHEREPDAGIEDAAIPEDAPPVVDAGPPGCHAVCPPPRLVAHVALPGRHDVPAPGAFADAVEVDGTLVVLTARANIGYAGPVYRVLFFEAATGEVRASAPWTGVGAYAQHIDGARIVRASRDGIGVIALVGQPHFSRPLMPTGRQAVEVHHVEWRFDGALARAQRITSFPDGDTLACPGGCRGGIAVADDRVVVSYAPGGEMWRTEIALPELRAGAWEREREIEDPEPAPWPHESVFWEGERWIAGGGTPDNELPRRGWLIGPDEVEALAGTSDDLPPLLLGGPTLVLARHIASESRVAVQRLRPGEPLEALSVRTGTLGPLASWLARGLGDRTVLAWLSLAPGSLRDTVLRVVTDLPFEACGEEVEPADVARIPDGITAPAVLAHAVGDRLFAMTLVPQSGGGGRSLAVFEISDCAMIDP